MSFTEGVDAQGKPVQHPRPQHPENYLQGVYRCGQRRKHELRIHRSKWPPRQHPNLNDKPHVSGHCENCGAVCLVYDPPQSDITVVLYGEAGSEVGQVRDEEGTVMDEHEVPQAGQVVDEPEPLRGKGRR